jgi:hypothetical protein
MFISFFAETKLKRKNVTEHRTGKPDLARESTIDRSPLLNVDYKITCKVLVARMKDAMDEIV